TYMPPGAAEMRGQQLATLDKIAHELGTSAELGQLLDDLQPYAETLDPDSDDARLIHFARRDFERATRVPPAFVVERARVVTLANQAWMEAKAKADFSIFRPHLERIVDLAHRYVSFFPPADHPYDILLDGYEPAMKTAEVKEIFDILRPQQTALIRAIAERPQVDDSFLHQHFDEQKQWEFGVEVITKFGYDWKRGRQDKSAHPFTGGPGLHDVRITTRVAPDYFNTMFFGTLHEAGHALYEQGTSPTLARTNLLGGASLAVHESQSRMWENLVGRSLPFWEHFYPRLQALFPQLDDISLEAFYKGINKVQPSFIRVEADEATYNLHIMLRLELEIALIEGNLAVADLPEVWNQKMHEYLGVTPPNDAKGVLQDIHWSWGLFGYFSTYALGNLISVQLWEKIRQDIPDLDDQIRAGKFDALLSWLREKIHVHGRKFMPQELVQRVTGSKIDPTPYLRYLQQKYSQIYAL
ncbi:MAG: carboxypeptidase M32, partial [Anaerolineales bacterium]|nr:carboxypeptidase M32 [Anaerolineales bacterium]MDW8228065.1 carboxypeptidase M32 [Anaerolineales bacterium]